MEIVEPGDLIVSAVPKAPIGRSFAFVDGVRRIEASLYQFTNGSLVRGVAGAYAVGSVVVSAHAVAFASDISRLIVSGTRPAEREIRHRLHDLTMRRQRYVVDVVRAAIIDGRRLLAAVAQIAVVPRPLPVLALTDGIEDDVTWTRSTSNWCRAACASLATEREDIAKALADSRSQAQALVRAEGLASVAELATASAMAADNATIAREQLRNAEEADRQADAARARVATIEPIANALETLRGYLHSNRFKEYVMRRRELRLLGLATVVLQRMTDGRYAFAERFAILDGANQHTRDARTLSGGEKFLASLALALALVEIAARAGGRLDAIFLDEGFGSLDASALDGALTELARRATSGKMIGVITHVRGIASEINTVLRVQCLPSGSVVTRLDAEEREALFEDAASGLLEASA